MSFLQNIRNKPEHVRRRIAWWLMSVCVVVVVGVWLASFFIVPAEHADSGAPDSARSWRDALAEIWSTRPDIVDTETDTEVVRVYGEEVVGDEIVLTASSSPADRAPQTRHHQAF